MSDGFPSRSCADVILSHGEVEATRCHSLPVYLVFCRGHKMDEVRTRLTQEPRALWTVMRAGQSIVVPGPDRARPGCS
jgi:hypothetical protein